MMNSEGSVMHLHFNKDGSVRSSPNPHLQTSPSSKDDAFQYIIQQNTLLHEELGKLRAEIITLNVDKKALKRAKSDLEEEMHSLERSKTLLKGYLKNEVELDTYYKIILDEYEGKFDLFRKEFYFFHKVVVVQGILFITAKLALNALYYVHFRGLFYEIMNFSMMILLFGNFIESVRKARSVFLTFSNADMTNEIKDTKKLIVETLKGNDYIGDLVDNM
jgi:hypothetical protein